MTSASNEKFSVLGRKSNANEILTHNPYSAALNHKTRIPNSTLKHPIGQA